MNRTLVICSVIMAALIGFIVYVESTRPKPTDWSPVYTLSAKSPFGLHVFDKESKSLFKEGKVTKFSVTPYEYFEPLYNYDRKEYKPKGTVITIANTSDIDNESVKELIYFAEHGNTVFLSMKSFPQQLLDTLKVELEYHVFKDTLTITVNGKPDMFIFTKGIGTSYFSSIDTLTSVVLGYQKTDTLKQANFIKVPFGKGSFLLHTQPAAFTNFHLLNSDHYKYTEALVSYIPKGNIYWNASQFINNGESGSAFRYILKQPALRWAMYLSVIGTLVFIFFNAKRKQRIIPEIIPYKNTTVDFAKTIGNLYYQQGSHDIIIEKKIIYFLENIRNDYLIDTSGLNDEFVQKLQAKTGNTFEDIQKTTGLINKYRHRFNNTETDVIELNKAIEKLRL